MKITLFVAFFLSFLESAQLAKKDVLKATHELLEKEVKRLSSEKIKCNQPKVTLKVIDNLRLTNQVDQGISCLIGHLQNNNKDDGRMWSALGHFYQQKPKQYYSSLATTSFKQASKLIGKISPIISEWSFIGPFVIGKTEVDGDPLEMFGGIKNVSRKRFQKSPLFISELVVGGEVKWTVIKQKSGEYIQLSPKVNWGVLVNALGSVGITEWQGWLVGDFYVNEKDQNVLIQCLGVHSIYVNDRLVTGDVYRRNQFWFSPGHLDRGLHTIYVKVRTKGQAALLCSIKLASSTFEILSPAFLPDLVNGHLFSYHIALPISNLHSTKWLKNIRISISSQDEGHPISAKVLDRFAIAPGQTRPVNFMIQSENEKLIDSCQELGLKLKVTTSEGHNIFPLSLRCRKEGESFLFTFLDHDGSIQHAAALYPIGGCESDVCPTLLTLHGTTVPPQNQADSYKRMEEGQFLFGVDGTWLLAPTRYTFKSTVAITDFEAMCYRHGAHNWEGPGSSTAMTALSRLAELTRRSWIRHQASPWHVIFAGHSMGGHGAWHLATHYPDRALALISLSGWIKKEDYGDSNLFFRHDISTSHTDPAIKAVLEACIAENDADRHVTNLQNIPVLVRVGADDQTVHPYFQRRMYRLLREQNVSVTYSELEGKEHWWWDTWETNDGGTVNDKQIREFVAQHSTTSNSNGWCSVDGDCGDVKESMYAGRQTFTLTVFNPALGESVRGVAVLQQHTPFRLSKVEGVVTSNEVILLTTNVRRLRLATAYNRPIKWRGKQLTIDNQEVMMSAENQKSSELMFTKSSGTWEFVSNITQTKERSPLTLGPARRITEQQFLIVIGEGDNQDWGIMVQQLAVYIANLFMLTSDAYSPIIRDTDLTDTMLSDYNLIIIGGPSQNRFTQQFLDLVSLSYSPDSGFHLGSCHFFHPANGALFLAPNGQGHLALVLMGHSIEGLKDVVSLASPTIPPMTRSPFSNMIPDFVITGHEYRAKGPGGYLCTGFWGNAWELRPELASCTC